MIVKSPFNYDADIESFKTGVDCSDSPTMTQQHFRDECDINVMVARFQRTGMPDAPVVPPGVAEFSEIFDFQSAMQVIIDAREAFDSLPSKLRDRFQNDPSRYLAFFHDESNRAEAERLGLITSSTVLPVSVPSFSPVDTPAPTPSPEGS